MSPVLMTSLAAPGRSSRDQRNTATSSSFQSLADRHLTEYNPEYYGAVRLRKSKICPTTDET